MLYLKDAVYNIPPSMSVGLDEFDCLLAGDRKTVDIDMFEFFFVIQVYGIGK